MNHKFEPSIIRAYDIRGIFNNNLFVKDAFFIGKSFVKFLSKNINQDKIFKIAVGCDGRSSSPILKIELLKALLGSKVKIIDIGLVATPMLYFATHYHGCDAGIMITGSHNPKDYNGFKITLREYPFYGNDLLELAKIAEKGDFIDGDGELIEIDISDDYLNRILNDCLISKSNSELLDEVDEFIPNKKLKIAWDCGNGATGDIITKLDSRIYCDNILLFNKIDGDFPNHHPDPTVADNLIDLQKAVIDNNCDFGVAFDGDGDRIGVVDNQQNILWGDQLMMLFSKEILENKPNSTIIADVKASSFLFNEIEKNNGIPLMWKTGHSLIKAKMKEVKSPLAGEMSGHIFFADKYYGFDDAIYAAIRLINIVYNSRSSLAELRSKLPQGFATPEIRIECDDKLKFDIVTILQDKLREDKIKFNDTDGLRVDLQNGEGWWLIRASNTQPVLVARCEAVSLNKLEELKKQIILLLKPFDLDVNFDNNH